MEQQCNCGMPDRWASDPSFPVVFDVEMNEYAVVHGPNHRAQAIMRYCFWCGGALPDSKRGTFFMEPDPEEIAALKRVLAAINDVRSMRAALGEPDSAMDWSRDEHRQQEGTYEFERWVREYTYDSRWKTLCLTIAEKEDGSVSCAFFGKRKGR